jgi:hypothetical protein
VKTASGSNPLSYQWLKDGSNIEGADQPLYTISNAQNGDARSYSIVITNSYGSVTSSNALLTILPTPPTISQQPAHEEPMWVGALARFNVIASGSEPLSYQWRKDGVNISGATSPTFTLSSVRSADAGSYSVVISNAYDSVTSSNALLTVGPKPLQTRVPGNVISWGPRSTPIVNAGTHFTKVAAGGGSLALKSDGMVIACGGQGKVPDGLYGLSPSPVITWLLNLTGQ